MRPSFEFLLNLTPKVMNNDEQFKENLSKSVIIELLKKNVIRFPEQNTLNTKVKKLETLRKKFLGVFL